MVGVVFDRGHFLASSVRRLDLIWRYFATLGVIQRRRAIVILGSWHLATPKLIERMSAFDPSAPLSREDLRNAYLATASSCLSKLNLSYSTQSSASLSLANRPIIMTVQLALRPVAANPS